MSDSSAIQAQAKKFQKMQVSDHVYELLHEENPNVEVVFFHGWQTKGSDPKQAFWRTWKMRESEECWPETLLREILNEENQGTVYRPRVLSISYESTLDPGKDGKGTESSNDYLIVESLILELILHMNVGKRHGVPVLLVGHDLGGTLIKKLVMEVENRAATAFDGDDKAKLNKFLQNLTSVFFYATPQAGSSALQEMAEKLDPKNANQMLRLMKVLDREIARINCDFQRFRRPEPGSNRLGFSTYGIHALYSTNRAGFHRQVVEEASARADVDEFFSARADHFTVCQPVDRFTSELQLLCNRIKRDILTMQERALTPNRSTRMETHRTFTTNDGRTHRMA